MLNNFTANADIHGQRVDLSWTWSGGQSRPGMCLVRRQRAYPTDIDDGLRILESADLQMMTTQGWARLERISYHGENMLVDSGLYLAQVSAYFDKLDATDIYPEKIKFDYFEFGQAETIILEEISRIEIIVTDTPSWQRVERKRIHAKPGGGDEEVLGDFVIYTGHLDGISKDRLEWNPQTGSSVSLEFAHCIKPVLTIEVESIEDRDNSIWRHKLRLTDSALLPEEIFYYRLFISDPATPTVFRTERDWRVTAVPTRRYGLDDKLYKLLPSLHQYHDESDPSQSGKGQLRSYLSIFGHALDQIRSSAEALSNRQDILHVHSDQLPLLSRWIGWELDTTQHEINQRNDILLAPEVYRSVGSVPNIRALVNHITGWDCKVKEFVHNVCLTNSPETIKLSEIWERHFTGSPGDDMADKNSWSTATAITRTEGFDGHPAVVTDSQDKEWLFWHSDHSGQREIWYQRLGSVDAMPRRLREDLPNDTLNQLQDNYIDEYPVVVSCNSSVQLFWNSNRKGSWDIWTCVFTGNSVTPASRLTDHKAVDRHPTVVCTDQTVGKLKLFWESDRRGPTDIWMMSYDGNEWSAPEQVTTAEFHHYDPTAALDNSGRFWLVWSDDRGDRQNLYARTYDGTWSKTYAITTGQQRDLSPSLVLWNSELWLILHSNHSKHWRIVAQKWSWSSGKPVAESDPIILTDDVTGNKEPCAFINNDNQLSVYWRSGYRGQIYQSRTFDVNDPELKGRLGTFHDRAHYTYDTGKKHEDKFSRDTVGIYLTPDTDAPDQINRNRRLVEGPLKNFLSVNTRAELFILPAIYREYVYPPGHDIKEYFERETTTVTTEVYSGLGDSYEDLLPEWVWLRAWSQLYPDHYTADTTQQPVDTSHRTWHVGLSNGG